MEVSERENELKVKKICRFCLCQEKLESIFAQAKFPMQIMAIASIEVFPNDGMPSWVCNECHLLFEHSYRFKQMCKRAETLLKQYPLTGTWPNALVKPRIPLALVPKATAPTKAGLLSVPITSPAPSVLTTLPTNIEPPPKTSTILSTMPLKIVPTSPKLSAVQTYARKSISPKKITTQNTQNGQRIVKAIKILNANPVASPEPPVPVRIKREKIDEEPSSVMVVKADIDEILENNINEFIGISTNGTDMIVNSIEVKKKPRVLNKSSIRILNKEAEVMIEPRLREPQVKCDEDGNMAIITEIIDPNEPYDTEPDPVKNAVPVETNVFPCPHCERSFPLRQLRDIHIENHKRERSFPCAHCDWSFFSKYDLQKHALVHSGDRPFKCSVCDKGFTRATLLHRHEKTHTDIPKYLCVYCEKPFLSKEEMEKHTENHKKNRPFQCKICFKSFAFKQGLERHEVVHSRDQPYPCQYCEQRFSTPSKLARHLTAHAGKRPYPCKFCSKSYLLSHHLTRHLRSHKQGSDSFQCGECRTEFKTRDALIAHSVTHAAQTLCCPMCKDSFKDVKMVELHIKAHADGDAYACEFCDLIFITPDRLQAHTDADHAEDMKAYHDDDKAQAQRAKQVEVATDDLQQTIDAFLDDDLNSGRIQILSQEIIVSTKEALDSLNPKRPVNKLLLKVDDPLKFRKMTTNSAKPPEDLNTVANVVQKTTEVKAKKEIKKQLEELPAPPIKLRKVVTNCKSVTKVEETPEIRRKVPKPNEQTQSKPPAVKSRDSNQPLINTMLKSLPKGISVRRNEPMVVNRTPASSVSTPTDDSKQRVIRTSLRRPNDVNTDSSIKSSPNEKVAKTGTQSERIIKRITMTRAEAELMTRDGRIRIKDGNMYLTKNSVSGGKPPTK